MDSLVKKAHTKSLRFKLFGGFLATVGLLMIVEIIGIYSTQKIHKEINVFYKVNPLVGAAKNAQLSVAKDQNLMISMLAADSRQELQELWTEHRGLDKQFTVQIDAMLNGGKIKGVNVYATQDEKLRDLLKNAINFHKQEFLPRIYGIFLLKDRVLYEKEEGINVNIPGRNQAIHKQVKLIDVEANSIASRMNTILNEIENSSQKELTRTRTYLEKLVSSTVSNALLGGAIFLIVSLVLALSITNSLTRPISQTISQLKGASSDLAMVSSQIASSNEKLLDGTSQQATATEKTSSAISDIGSMVERNVDSTTTLRDVVIKNENMVSSGKNSVKEMVASINEINDQNTEVSRQMETNARQLQNITQIIGEINDKTKIIDEIVFQTKILSFNASVEAARAGIHGKGFSIVAAEIGNLAKVSGNASKEISALLEQSTEKINSISTESSKQVSELIQMAKSTVEKGILRADDCQKALDNILVGANSVHEMAELIANSSKEQAQRAQEINDSMKDLNSVTRDNSSLTEASVQFTDNLLTHSSNLFKIVQRMSVLLYGLRKEDNAPEEDPVKPQLDSKTQDAA